MQIGIMDQLIYLFTKFYLRHANTDKVESKNLI